jgi:hypothetical protein
MTSNVFGSVFSVNSADVFGSVFSMQDGSTGWVYFVLMQ